ncbi:MAG: FliI/YscN family ATPase [Nitrospirae bacterium]|nr:MAG: FliI/YscN family ATPase [Nitrospirota bacterium]
MHSAQLSRLDALETVSVYGRVVKAVGLTVEATSPVATIGQGCRIVCRNGSVLDAEVVGFRGETALLMPLGEVRGIGPGDRVLFEAHPLHIPVSPLLLGRVVDGRGQAIDDGPPIPATLRYPLYRQPPHPLERERIREPLDLGIRAINACLTCGVGQKLGIFAGSGVGKSVLLGMMCRYARAEINVIALIGERGREVREFLERELGAEGRQRSVIVVATSDQPALVRLRAAYLATAIAEYFRDLGKHVLLMMDSLTRVAYAQREVGLAVGEPPTAKGYPPSAFAVFPQLLERTGCTREGSITGLYTVLVEGDDLTDPIADSVRAILDGHIVLSRSLAMKGHYPAIDLLHSLSRVMSDVVSPDQLTDVRLLSQVMATYRDAEEMIQIGAYQPGTNPRLDLAIQMHEAIVQFLCQDREERASMAKSLQALRDLVNEIERRRSSETR